MFSSLIDELKTALASMPMSVQQDLMPVEDQQGLPLINIRRRGDSQLERGSVYEVRQLNIEIDVILATHSNSIALINGYLEQMTTLIGAFSFSALMVNITGYEFPDPNPEDFAVIGTIALTLTYEKAR